MIGDRIRDYRNQHRLTQVKLAEAVGVGQGVVSKWERHKMRPEYESLDALSRLFGLTIDAFTAGTDMSKAERIAEEHKKSETSSQGPSYTERTDSAIQGTPDDAGFDFLSGLRAALSSQNLPALEELSGELLSSVRKIRDVGVFLEKLSAALDSTRVPGAAGHGAAGPGGATDSASSREPPDEGLLPPASGGSAR